MGEISRVVSVDKDDESAVVAGPQRTQTVRLMTLPRGKGEGPLKEGDWLVVHSGLALERLTAREARDALNIRGTVAATKEES